jgi:antitoxin component of MazEF toxin-antitoxin module
MSYKSKSIEVPKELFAMFKNNGANRSLVRVGTSISVVIPALLFKAGIWNKNDKVNLIIINDDMIIILNPNATDRLNKNNIIREVILNE